MEVTEEGGEEDGTCALQDREGTSACLRREAPLSDHSLKEWLLMPDSGDRETAATGTERIFEDGTPFYSDISLGERQPLQAVPLMMPREQTAPVLQSESEHMSITAWARHRHCHDDVDGARGVPYFQSNVSPRRSSFAFRRPRVFTPHTPIAPAVLKATPTHEATPTPEITPSSEATHKHEAAPTHEAIPIREDTPNCEAMPTHEATPIHEATPAPKAPPIHRVSPITAASLTPKATPIHRVSPIARAMLNPRATSTSRTLPCRNARHADHEVVGGSHQKLHTESDHSDQFIAELKKAVKMRNKESTSHWRTTLTAAREPEEESPVADLPLCKAKPSRKMRVEVLCPRRFKSNPYFRSVHFHPHGQRKGAEVAQEERRKLEAGQLHEEPDLKEFEKTAGKSRPNEFRFESGILGNGRAECELESEVLQPNAEEMLYGYHHQSSRTASMDEYFHSEDDEEEDYSEIMCSLHACRSRYCAGRKRATNWGLSGAAAVAFPSSQLSTPSGPHFPPSIPVKGRLVEDRQELARGDYSFLRCLSYLILCGVSVAVPMTLSSSSLAAFLPIFDACWGV